MPLVPSVTELVIAQLLYLNFQSEATITIYINSPGTNSPDGRAFSFDTEAFAIADTMQVLYNVDIDFTPMMILPQDYYALLIILLAMFSSFPPISLFLTPYTVCTTPYPHHMRRSGLRHSRHASIPWSEG
jgi:hypothetical protein